MSFDNICKYLSETYPEPFVSWLLGESPASVEILKTELSLEPIRADFLTFIRTQSQILHLEFQTQVKSEPPLPLRMLDYWIRLYRRYRVPINQVIILLKETTSAAATEEQFQVGETRHRYRVIRMWEQEPDPFLHNIALLPFASLCRTDAPEQLLNQVAQSVSNIEESERGTIAACTEILAGLRFNNDLIEQLFREEIMRESVVYQRILQEGREAGREEGREEGREKGMQQALKSSILDALEDKFSIQELLVQLDSLTLEQLQRLNRYAWSCQTRESFLEQLKFIR